jgi:hypothetical protein
MRGEALISLHDADVLLASIGPLKFLSSAAFEIPMQPRNPENIPEHPQRVRNQIDFGTRLCHPVDRYLKDGE